MRAHDDSVMQHEPAQPRGSATTEASRPLVQGGILRDKAVRSWRAQQLTAAGYPEDVAAELSADPGVDLHVAVDLLRRGCPLETALRILG